MNKKNPEILAPGGDFNSAVHAFNNGADAVYVGLKSFSARKGATNFTIDELRRLKTVASEGKKSIYVAINTLIHQNEIANLLPILSQLEEISVNGIIVQDLGLASIINKYIKIPLHASTQLAVHNSHGVKMMENLGFSRVVLSRELSLIELKKLRDEFPKMEFEVFIHGALCYGFSGLCLASSKLLGRSANRGECGQICRTWFNNGDKKEYCFSLNDLCLKEDVLELKKIGIDSLKIEGRLKGPQYAASTSKLYSEIIGGKDFQTSFDKTQVEFNRSGHKAYIPGERRGAVVNTEYPGHIGKIIGKITSIKPESFTVIVSDEIENRDGVMVLEQRSPLYPIKFAVNIISKDGNTLQLKGKLPKNIKSELYKISNHDHNLKEEKLQKYKPWKTIVNTSMIIRDNILEILANDHKFSYPLTIEEAKTPVDIALIFNKIFKAGGESRFKFPVTIKNESGIKNIFIPTSLLKNIRKKFQTEYQTAVEESYILWKEEILSKEPEIKPESSYIKNKMDIPFITNFNSIDLSLLKKKDNSYLLPLTPVVFDSQNYLKQLKLFLDKNKNSKFIIGLNNIGHIAFIPELPSTIEYYCDYALFNTNNFSKQLYNRLIPNLIWVTKWVENDKTEGIPPIFISRSCFKAKDGGCPINCKRNYKYYINQQNRNYTVIVKDCLTYTFIASEPLL